MLKIVPCNVMQFSCTQCFRTNECIDIQSLPKMKRMYPMKSKVNDVNEFIL